MNAAAGSDGGTVVAGRGFSVASRTAPRPAQLHTPANSAPTMPSATLWDRENVMGGILPLVRRNTAQVGGVIIVE
jgi:hypothetical protein